jgi:hypothetical protein
MAKQSSERVGIAPLQEYKLVPVTDPAELAERERRFRDARRVVEVETTPAGVREVYRQLPAAERLKLLARLAGELSADEQRELVEQLKARLRSDAAEPVHEPKRRRNGKA